jgi:hypothetical protein
MQVSSCHRERRKNKGKERKGDILALLAGGGGSWVGDNSKAMCLEFFFNTVSTLSVIWRCLPCLESQW